MRIKLIPTFILLMLMLAACGSNQSQKQSSTRAVIKAPVCQSTLPMMSDTTSSTSSQAATAQHMNMGPHMKMTPYQPITEQTLFKANSLFGLTGTISTQAQCTKVGGTFYSSMYGWMVHIPLFGSVGAG